MRKSETFGVRLDPEVKTRLQNLIEASGQHKKDYVTRLVFSLEAQRAKQTLQGVPELERLESHLSRIGEIFSEILKAGKDQVEWSQDRIARLEQQCADAVTQAEIARAEAEEARSRADQVIAHTEQQLQEMRAALLRAERLADLSQSAVDESKAKLDDIAAKAQEADTLRHTLADLQQERDEQARRLAEAVLEQERAVLAAERKAMVDRSALLEALANEREKVAALEVKLALAGGH